MSGETVQHQLSCRDKLLFSQAVYELGNDAWHKVSEILSNHPLIKLSDSVLAPNSCAAIYAQLTAELPDDTEGRDNIAANDKPHARFHLRLAQKHYNARVQELRKAIAATELEFQAVAGEVELLRAGGQDDKIAAQLRANQEAGESKVGDVIRDKTAEIEDRVKDVDEKTPTADAVIADVVASRDADEDMVEAHATLQLDSQESEGTEPDKASRTVSPRAAEEEVQDATKETTKESRLNESRSVLSVHADAPIATSSTEDVPQKLPADESNNQAESSVEQASSAARRQQREKAKPTRTSRRTRNKSPSPAADEVSEKDEPATPSEPPSATAEKGETPLELQDGKQVGDDESMQVDEDSATAPAATELETPRKTRPDLRLESTTSPPTAATSPVLDALGDEGASNAARTASTRKGKRKAMELDEKLSRPMKRLREASENFDTGDEGEVSTPARKEMKASDDKSRQVADFKRFIGMLHYVIQGHKSGNIFHRPISKADAPDYGDIVKRAMDLKTIKMRYTKTGEISTPTEYHRDLSLMFCNALMFNRPNSDIYKMAQNMMLDCEKQVQDFFQTHDSLHR